MGTGTGIGKGLSLYQGETGKNQGRTIGKNQGEPRKNHREEPREEPGPVTMARNHGQEPWPGTSVKNHGPGTLLRYVSYFLRGKVRFLLS